MPWAQSSGSEHDGGSERQSRCQNGSNLKTGWLFDRAPPGNYSGYLMYLWYVAPRILLSTCLSTRNYPLGVRLNTHELTTHASLVVFQSSRFSPVLDSIGRPGWSPPVNNSDTCSYPLPCRMPSINHLVCLDSSIPFDS